MTDKLLFYKPMTKLVKANLLVGTLKRMGIREFQLTPDLKKVMNIKWACIISNSQDWFVIGACRNRKEFN